MPSFDIVCETNLQEVSNAVNQVKKEIATRYDFKDSIASISLQDHQITVVAEDEHRLNAVTEILRARLVRRGLDPKCLEYADPEPASGGAKRQLITVKQGIGTDLAKSIVKAIKQEKMKVQAAIQGDQIRVSGKKRDDLQAVIALVKGLPSDRPLAFTNFRD